MTDPLDQLTTLAKRMKTRSAVVAKRATAAGVERIPLHGLRVDYDYQRPPDHEKIASMREVLKAGGGLPPIKVNRRPDGSMWITNGQHRAAARALEGETHVDAIITEKPTQEEPKDTGILTKVAKEHDHDALDRLRGAGAKPLGKTLMLDLGKAGTVRYTPHAARWAAMGERGWIDVQGPDHELVLERLDLTPLLAEKVQETG